MVRVRRAETRDSGNIRVARGGGALAYGPSLSLMSTLRKWTRMTLGVAQALCNSLHRLPGHGDPDVCDNGPRHGGCVI